MNLTVQSVLRWLEDCQGITICGQEIKWGRVKTIFKGTEGNRSVFVKIGITEEAKKEVLMNKNGYDKMREIGAGNYTPNPRFVEFQGVPIIIMDDCGENLFDMLKGAVNPRSIFDRICEELWHLYRITKIKGGAEESLENSFRILEEQFSRYLSVYEPFSANQRLLKEIRKKIFRVRSPFICFAFWNFTPEDMCLSTSGLKIIDPPGCVVGLPMIDLACFAGSVRDASKLPGAEYGYDLLKKLASDAGEMLGLKPKDTEFLFNFGRAVQCSLSARYRIGEEDGLSKKFFVEAKEFLAKCLSQRN